MNWIQAKSARLAIHLETRAIPIPPRLGPIAGTPGVPPPQVWRWSAAPKVSEIVDIARLTHHGAVGEQRVLGESRPALKNEVMAKLYARIGFSAANESFFACEVTAGGNGMIR